MLPNLSISGLAPGKADDDETETVIDEKTIQVKSVDTPILNRLVHIMKKQKFEDKQIIELLADLNDDKHPSESPVLSPDQCSLKTLKKASTNPFLIDCGVKVGFLKRKLDSLKSTDRKVEALKAWRDKNPNEKLDVTLQKYLRESINLSSIKHIKNLEYLASAFGEVFKNAEEYYLNPIENEIVEKLKKENSVTVFKWFVGKCKDRVMHLTPALKKKLREYFDLALFNKEKLLNLEELSIAFEIMTDEP